MMDVGHPEIADAVRRALEEDIGAGDVTSNACVPSEREASGEFIARQTQIVAGVGTIAADIHDRCSLKKQSGDKVVAGRHHRFRRRQRPWHTRLRAR